MTVQNTQTETVRTEAAPQQGGNTNPGYYKNRAFECVGFAQYLNFNLGNAFKYIWRHKEKGGREDLEKALRYLERQRADAPKFKKLKCRRYEKNVRRSERLRVRRRHGGRAACRHLRRLLHPRRRRQFCVGGRLCRRFVGKNAA
ncbi:putative phage associated protein [Neisseria gonorrhoeae]|nr:putative phage associated protein [Neisseria gonorrhoeae]